MQKFITISGNRAGSTWFQHMMNSLEGVCSDYEAQIERTVPTPQHLPLLAPNFSLETTLVNLAKESNSIISGTKVVLPGTKRYEQSDFDILFEMLTDFQIIHIGRDYFDCYYSKFLNRGHLLNENGVPPAKHTEYWLSSSPKNHFTEKTIDKEALIRDLENRLNNDSLIFKNFSKEKNYKYIEYNDIKDRFIEITKEITPKIEEEKALETLNNPATIKHKKIEKKDSIKNYEEIKEIEETYKIKRNKLIDIFLREIHA